MRIGVFSHYFYPEVGAPSARVGDFAREWVKDGHEVHVVTCFPNHPTGRVYPGYELGAYMHELVDGINVHRNWSYVTANKGTVRKTVGHLSFWLAARMFSFHRIPALSCAIGTSPTFFAAMTARDYAKGRRIPFIMEVRDLWPAIFRDLGVVRNRLALKLLERWEMGLYRSAKRVVTVTDAFRGDLLGRGIAEGKVATVANGADTEFWEFSRGNRDQLRMKLGMKGKFIVLYIGAHGISQGLNAQLLAASRLKDHREIEFLFVGAGAEKSNLVDVAMKLGLGNVQFHEHTGREMVRDYYSAADVCLVPLRGLPLFDSFVPSKIFEIMSMGRPILASLRGEAARILFRAGCAKIVAPDDDEAIASAVLEMSRSPAMLDEMGLAGRRFVTTHYTRKKLAESYLEIISGAIAGNLAGQSSR